jgi:hypothetical protein
MAGDVVSLLVDREARLERVLYAADFRISAQGRRWTMTKQERADYYAQLRRVIKYLATIPGAQAIVVEWQDSFTGNVEEFLVPAAGAASVRDDWAVPGESAALYLDGDFELWHIDGDEDEDSLTAAFTRLREKHHVEIKPVLFEPAGLAWDNEARRYRGRVRILFSVFD